MRRLLAIMILLGIIAISNVDMSNAQDTLVSLVSTYPERADPLNEITLEVRITNTTDLMMWDPVISLDLSEDYENYFDLIDEEVTVDMGDQHFIPINGSVTTYYRIYVNANCPAQKHIIPVNISYRSGSCEGGCQKAEISGQIAVPIYRQDPKVAMSVTGPSEVLPGDPLIVTTELRNFGTGSAINIDITATSDPFIEGLETEIVYGGETVELEVSSTLLANVNADSMKLDPGFYTFYIYMQYEDKYGNKMFLNDEWEVKVIGTPSQEAEFQADQLKELGINAFQIKNFTTSISYLKRAIELYSRLDMFSEITECQNYIFLSTNYLQANNYFNIGEEFLQENDYQNAKNYYNYAKETYETLGNTKKVAECRSRIDMCDQELNRLMIMEHGAYGAVIFCILYGILAKRKEIYKKLKSE